MQDVALAAGLAAGMGVPPDHVSCVAGPDCVVAASAQQLVVNPLEPSQDAAFVVGVPAVVTDLRPSLMAGHGQRGCPVGERREQRRRDQRAGPPPHAHPRARTITVAPREGIIVTLR